MPVFEKSKDIFTDPEILMRKKHFLLDSRNSLLHNDCEVKIETLHKYHLNKQTSNQI